MPPKVILLTGAPASSLVDPSSCTIDEFEGHICRFMGIPRDPSSSPHPPQTPATHATWRALSLVRQPLHTGFSQTHRRPEGQGDASDNFFTTADISISDGPAGSEDADALTQFCEESLALHNPLPSSQLGSSDRSNSSFTETSFLSTISIRSDVNHGQMAPPPVPPHLSDLEDIPRAHQVLALNPQTITVNLIVGIISIAQPRTVTTRWGRSMCLIEILVGDETKSGFAITFWVPSDAVAGSKVSLVRNQDVVLMQNVALHVFRGKVYGQSLRRDMTRINLLWRRDGGGQYTTRDLNMRSRSRHDPQRDKTRAVKEWTLHFVGGEAKAQESKGKKSWDEPPDDTQ